jgi:ABC-type oligopeptide transport system ATPase subunit
MALMALNLPVLRALEQVGLSSDYRFRFCDQLAGGQHQQFEIARARVRVALDKHVL